MLMVYQGRERTLACQVLYLGATRRGRALRSQAELVCVIVGYRGSVVNEMSEVGPVGGYRFVELL
jgi:hypothetical protein